jgi:hypothetical protein
MAIGMYFHPESLTAQQYDEAVSELQAAGAWSPAGRLHHSCFGPDGNLSVYEIWDSQQSYDRFGQVLMPILQKLGIDPGTPDTVPIHNMVG